jgi:hypothetical protein
MKQYPQICLVTLLAVVGCMSKKAEQTATAGSISMCRAAATVLGIDALPTPQHRTGIGSSHLRITTNDKTAQLWFDQGLNYCMAFGT